MCYRVAAVNMGSFGQPRLRCLIELFIAGVGLPILGQVVEWQTRQFQKLVPRGVRVQVPPWSLGEKT